MITDECTNFEADITLLNSYHHLHYYYLILEKLVPSLKWLIDQMSAKVLVVEYELSVNKLLYKA